MNYEEKWKAERERRAYLALADGTVFHGVAFGAKKDALGEVVFNTGMCGYQEILTDPSYAGQFVTLTPAEVGNYGINADDIESRKLFLSGLVEIMVTRKPFCTLGNGEWGTGNGRRLPRRVNGKGSTARITRQR